MLKSYKELSRWYEPLEPDTGSSHGPHPDDEHPHLGDYEGPARFPHYIRDEPEELPRPEVPHDLPATHSEFTGGWSDWVAGRAPGPDDEYRVPREGDVVRFPWPDEDDYDDGSGAGPTRSAAALRVAVRERRSRRTRVVVVLIVALLLLAGATAGVVYLLGGRKADDAAGGPASMQLTSGGIDGAPPAGPCPTERSPAVVRSAEQGGTMSGPDAVLAFQYAYYVTRSGEQAWKVVAPNATVSSAALIQTGINSIPAGTKHCVRIVTVSDNVYSVEVTESRPGGAPETYNKQMVTTAVVDGRTLITGIAAG